MSILKLKQCHYFPVFGVRLMNVRLINRKKHCSLIHIVITSIQSTTPFFHWMSFGEQIYFKAKKIIKQKSHPGQLYEEEDSAENNFIFRQWEPPVNNQHHWTNQSHIQPQTSTGTKPCYDFTCLHLSQSYSLKTENRRRNNYHFKSMSMCKRKKKEEGINKYSSLPCRKAGR